MNLHNLKPAEGSVKKAKRIGRGQGSTRGGTSTRGNKGAGSRSGNSIKVGFEGGQMPLQRRLPKFGFRNINRVEYQGVNLSDLERVAVKNNITTFDFEVFRKYGLATKSEKVKILGKGELNRKVDVKAHAFSKSAIASIEAKGGKTENI
ncbi:MAG: 50S ribosomal protein L15 [Bacteroidetes bacterium]|nr:50S ribosomal protein L15 [Bacteroidota bacterium]